MSKIEILKTIFNKKYLVYRDNDLIVNNCGIMDVNGNIKVLPSYQNIQYPIGDWFIVSKQYNVYCENDYVYYGLLDKTFKILCDTDKQKYFSYTGFLAIESIVSKLYEEKYGMKQSQKN